MDIMYELKHSVMLKIHSYIKTFIHFHNLNSMITLQTINQDFKTVLTDYKQKWKTQLRVLSIELTIF